MSKIFKTADELVKVAPKDRPFRVKVESNPHGSGAEQILWGYVDKDNYLMSDIMNQENINGVGYSFGKYWHNIYIGTFELLDDDCDCQFKKPEVYEIGDIVEILESAKECGDYKIWTNSKKAMIGKRFEIDTVNDWYVGVNYRFYGYSCSFPHYCVKKVKLKTLELTLEEIAEEFGVDVSNLKIKK